MFSYIFEILNWWIGFYPSFICLSNNIMLSNCISVAVFWNILGITFEILLLVSMISIIGSSNNIIILLNFMSILILLSFKLMLNGVIELSIVIIMVYQSAILVLFLVNGLFLSNLFWLEIFIGIILSSCVLLFDTYCSGFITYLFGNHFLSYDSKYFYFFKSKVKVNKWLVYFYIYMLISYFCFLPFLL